MQGGSSAARGTRDHPLEPLLNPRSVAVIAASGRAHRPGNLIVESLRESGFSGPVYAVNPAYREILGYPCYGTVGDLPETVDLAILAGATDRIEGHLREAIAAGARAAFILATATSEVDGDPPLLARVRDLAREAGIPILGPYSIGFVNYAAGVGATWMKASAMTPGAIAAIVQSGATYGFLNALDPRLAFSLTVQPGQEATHTIADYMDYALDMPETRVLAIYLETLRDPEGFRSVLEKAKARGLPVVAIKPGRSAAGRAGVASHAGRLAGSEAGCEAVFERYGVMRCETMDEWFATAQMLAHEPRPGPGGVAAILDSGGQRSLLMDYASELGLPWSRINRDTTAGLRGRLAYGLPVENPVDAWGGDPDYPEVYRDCFKAIIEDPDSAMGVFFTEFGSKPSDQYLQMAGDLCRQLQVETGKPVIGVSHTARQFHPEVLLSMHDQGVPVLDGGKTALQAIRHAFAYRDFGLREPDESLTTADPAPVARWRGRLAQGALRDEEALALLADFGVPAVAMRPAADLAQTLAAGRALGWPVVLKTAEGVAHKTEARGVVLNLQDETALATAYQNLAARLGPRVLVMRQAPAGVELALGLVQDPQFGPLVMVGAGGTLVELLEDRCFALPPFGKDEAYRLLESLKVARLLAGYRGAPAVDRVALATAISGFSQLAASLGDAIAELDVNPLIAGPAGCLAVDALVVAQVLQETHTKEEP